jgi:hypothetical protein
MSSTSCGRKQGKSAAAAAYQRWRAQAAGQNVGKMARQVRTDTERASTSNSEPVGEVSGSVVACPRKKQWDQPNRCHRGAVKVGGIRGVAAEANT